MNDRLPLAATLAALPPVWPDDPRPGLRRAHRDNGAKLVVLDDDPTGTQTVYDVPVITAWDDAMLRAEFTDPHPACYILTNSRALPADESRALHADLGARLGRIAQDAGRRITVVSRSDSTLRGHFPLETDALASALGPFELTALVPFFDAGGRYTIADVHYVAEGDVLVPAAATPFARDAAFGYRSSSLPQWVEEKTGGRIRAHQVRTIPLEALRLEGPDGVAARLRTLPSGTVVAVNAAAARDVEVFAAAALKLEGEGHRILYRTAASFVAARLGLEPRPLLTCADLGPPMKTGGLIVAGSYVPKTTAQLEHLVASHPRLHVITLSVPCLLDPTRRESCIAGAALDMNRRLARGEDVLIQTSRQLVPGKDAAGSLAIGRHISNALIAIVQHLTDRPRFLIAKGGVTSSDIATEGLNIRRATVLGQLLPGVPVWRAGIEARFPGLGYIVFPGNVGGPEALAQAVARLGPADCPEDQTPRDRCRNPSVQK